MGYLIPLRVVVEDWLPYRFLSFVWFPTATFYITAFSPHVLYNQCMFIFNTVIVSPDSNCVRSESTCSCSVSAFVVSVLLEGCGAEGTRNRSSPSFISDLDAETGNFYKINEVNVSLLKNCLTN